MSLVSTCVHISPNAESVIVVVLLQLYARRKFFSPPVHVASYYTSVVEEVRAEAQATAFENLKEWEKLTEEEGDVLRWGKNASGTLPKRLNKTKVEREIYRQATAMECLVRGTRVLLACSRVGALIERALHDTWESIWTFLNTAVPLIIASLCRLGIYT